MFGRASALALVCGLAAPAAALASSSGGTGLASSTTTNTSKPKAHVSDTGHHYPGDSRHLGDRILKAGMRGSDVKVLQRDLTKAGYSTPASGYFGSATKSHVVRYQRAQAFKANGVVTWSVAVALQSPSSGGAAAIGDTTAPSSPTTATAPAGKATLIDGLAVAPSNAPAAIKGVIAAANQIATKPYIYGGGHGSWNDSGYDCSGSVSYALHGGGLLNTQDDSSDLESYGSAGAGRWITIWANSGHTYMYVAGLRYDTGAQSKTNGNDRWTTASRSNSGFIERHPTGY
jgi:peptidoglycan hydrolase-like protein with peptidoglycan-binding domain